MNDHDLSCLKASKHQYHEAILKRALERISSGIGGDLLGKTSLTREDMQEIARAAIARAEGVKP